MARLIIERDGTIERQVEVGDRDLRIGRDAGNDVVLDDPEKSVSRVHAELRHERGRYALIDLNSQNGIWLGGRRVSRVDLGPGVAVTLGSYSLTLEDLRGAAGAPADPVDATVGLTQTLGIPIEAPGPAAAVPPPPRPSATKPTPAQGSADPIAWLARQPKSYVFGGFAVIAILALVLPQLLRSGPPPSQSAAPGSTVATAPLSNEQRASALVENAKALLGGGDLDGAAGQVEQALLVVPNHAGALDLRAKIEAERQRHLPAVPSPGAGPPRSPEDADAIQIEWELAGLEDAIRRLRADASQTPPQIERQIQALDESLHRVRARMRADADEAYRRARQQDAEGRVGEAIVLYEQALRFWPPDEPNRRAARERLDALRGGR